MMTIRTFLILILVVSFAGCASPGKNSLKSVKVSSLSLGTEAVRLENLTNTDFPLLIIRYPAAVDELAFDEFTRRMIENPLHYTGKEWVQHRKFLKANGIKHDKSSDGADAATVIMGALAKTSFVAAEFYEYIKSRTNAIVILEPLAVGLDDGELKYSSFEGSKYPPSSVVVDLFIYSLPLDELSESFAAKYIPLITIRSGFRSGGEMLIASERLAETPSHSQKSAGHTVLDWLQRDLYAGLSEESIFPEQITAGKYISMNNPVIPNQTNVLRIERIDFKKQPFEDYINDKESARSPLIDKLFDPVLDRVAELHFSQNADYLENISDDYLNLVFDAETIDEAKMTMGQDRLRDLAHQALKAEVEKLQHSSDRLSDILLNQEYGKSIESIILKEINFEQREQVMTAFALVGAGIGGGVAAGMSNQAAAQTMLNSVNTTILAFSFGQKASAKNFSEILKQLMLEQRPAQEEIEVYGETIRIDTLEAYREKVAELILRIAIS